VAAMYAPSTVTHRVGKEGSEVTIAEETRYPFKDQIRFRMKMAQATKFPFTVRIPGWCKGAKISVNGQPLQQELASGTFVTIDRSFKDGDEVLVTLPQQIKLTEWP